MADLKIAESERNKLIDVFSKEPAFLDIFVERSSWVTSLQFSKDGKRILCGFENGAIRLWNLSDKELIHCLDHLGNVLCVSFLPSGRYALSGSKHGGLILWDLKSGKEKRRFETGKQLNSTRPKHAVSLSSNGRYALSGGWASPVFLWNIRTGRMIRDYGERKSSSYCWGVAFLPGDRQFIESYWRTITLHSVDTGEEIRQYNGHSSEIRTLTNTPDGKHIISGGFDGTIRVWDVESGNEVWRFGDEKNYIYSIACSPDSRRFISGGLDNKIHLWDITKGREIYCFEGHTDYVRSVAISPDGKFALSGSNDQTICLWKLPD